MPNSATINPPQPGYTHVQAAVISTPAVVPPTTGQIWPRSTGGATGPAGPTGADGPAGVTAGRVFYLDPTDASDVATYKRLLDSPSPGAESTVAVNCTGTGDVAVASFATDPGSPGVIDFPAGTAFRRFYARVSAGVARLHLQVYVRTAAGVETLARDEFSPTFSNIVVDTVSWEASLSAAGALNVTDRLVCKLYAQRVSGSASITVTTYFEGTSHASQIQTTISVGAAGPQGPPGPAGPVGTPPRVTVLPTTPSDGDEVNYIADATNGIVWRLKYNAGSASVYKWEFVGGSVLLGEFDALWQPVSPGLPGSEQAASSVTPPLEGDYDVEFGGTISGGVAVNDVVISARSSPSAGGGSAGTVRSKLVQLDLVTPGQEVYVARVSRLLAIPAGQVVYWNIYRSSATVVTFSSINRYLQLRPIRVR